MRGKESIYQWRADSKGLREVTDTPRGIDSHCGAAEGGHTPSDSPIRKILETEAGKGSRTRKVTQEFC